VYRCVSLTLFRSVAHEVGGETGNHVGEIEDVGNETIDHGVAENTDQTEDAMRTDGKGPVGKCAALRVSCQESFATEQDQSEQKLTVMPPTEEACDHINRQVTSGMDEIKTKENEGLVR
jgi:hypothetical protein